MGVVSSLCRPLYLASPFTPACVLCKGPMPPTLFIHTQWSLPCRKWSMTLK